MLRFNPISSCKACCTTHLVDEIDKPGGKPPKTLDELIVHVTIATEDAHGLADEVSTIFEGESMSVRL